MFKGRLFSNTIKIKLFVADNQCYIPLHLNKLEGSVHLLKLHDILTKENLVLKEKIDMGCPRNRLDRHVCFAGP